MNNQENDTPTIGCCGYHDTYNRTLEQTPPELMTAVFAIAEVNEEVAEILQGIDIAIKDHHFCAITTALYIHLARIRGELADASNAEEIDPEIDEAIEKLAS